MENANVKEDDIADDLETAGVYTTRVDTADDPDTTGGTLQE